jgi:PAS domain S-box-containing protein
MTTDTLQDNAYRWLFSLAPDPLLVVNASGVIVASNHAAQALFGYAESELRGSTLQSVLLARAHAGCRRDGAHPAGEVGQRDGIDGRRSDGSRFAADMTRRPLEDAMVLIGVRCVPGPAADHGRPGGSPWEAEARYRAVIEAAADGFWMLDGEGRILTVNDAYARRSGYSRQDLLGMCVADLEVQEAPEEVRAHIEKVRRNGSDLFESRHRAKDGEVWPVEVNASYWPEDGGCVFAFLRDVTERKRTEAALQTLHAEMERLMRFHVASQTAAAIAHELNQPLNAVSTYAEAALRLLSAGNAQPDKLRHALEGSAKQAQRAGRVVRELVAFLKQGDVDTDRVDINQAVRSALARLQADHHHGFQTRLELEPGLAPVRANRLQVEKVLLNLIGNGVEAMNDAGISPRSITVGVRTGADRGMAQVTVRDSGPGVESAIAHRIFEPFFTTKPKGLGMGLAISRAMIEAQGGQLWVESTPGSGATFHLTLPFAA